MLLSNEIFSSVGSINHFFIEKNDGPGPLSPRKFHQSLCCVKVENLAQKYRMNLCQSFLQLINEEASKMVKLIRGGYEKLSIFQKHLKMLD